jgi:menaquinol-cytochrome c reductase iron-sulfur subunit
MSHEHDAKNLPEPERRTFLGLAAGLITVSIGGVVTAAIGKYALEPAFNKAAGGDWSDLGPVTAFEEGKLIKKNITIAQDAGWGKFQAERAVWVVRTGEKVSVFSGVCPHLGCSVNADEQKFVCACHNSQWDAEGKATGGPTPRGLDRLEYRVEGGALQIRYQYFKQGVVEKEVLS